MKITEIIKDAFLFPSKNTGRFAIYLLLSVIMIGFVLGGLFTWAFGFVNKENYLIGGFYFVIAMIIGFIIIGYHIKIVKSGIEHDNNVPVFELYNDFMTGFDNIVLLIGYTIVLILITVVVGYGSNLFANIADLFQEIVLEVFNVYIMGDPIDSAVNALSPTIGNFANSLSITLTIATILFVIFSILYYVAEARLANTGSLTEAFNVFETVKDITRIGVGKTILLIISIILIIGIIEIILVIALSYVPFLLSVIYIIMTPYMGLVAQRAVGLLYSDIA